MGSFMNHGQKRLDHGIKQRVQLHKAEKEIHEFDVLLDEAILLNGKPISTA
jgi:hypothetical protein